MVRTGNKAYVDQKKVGFWAMLMTAPGTASSWGTRGKLGQKALRHTASALQHDQVWNIFSYISVNL